MLNARTQRLLSLLAIVSLCIILLFSYLGTPFRSLFLGAASINSIPGSSEGHHYAFATFYSTRVDDEAYDDPYFAATRTLAYQLLHQPNTKTILGTPLLVIVPPHVSERKRQVLREEGATVVLVDSIVPTSWTAHPMEDRWIDQFTKLAMFKMTEYGRILYMDSDTLIARPLDDIWEEEVVAVQQRTKPYPAEMQSVKLPSDFVIAGAVDNERADRERPTPVTSRSRLNAGFLVFKPDKDLYAYYMSLMDAPTPSFDGRFMEMGLLNHAHRRRGPMPWAALPAGQYSNNWPRLFDLKNGSATLHDKFWTPGNKDWIDRELVEMWWRVQGRMEGYWQGKGYDVK